jgi:hypothetical protein
MTTTNHWTPIGESIANLAQLNGGLQTIVSPFITASALERLLDEATGTDDLDVVCRWSRKDIATGIADLSLYAFLKARQIPLYIHERIHLKLYVCTNGTGFVTSGNATNKGLGYAERPNLEMGCKTQLSTSDFVNLYSILNESIPVTDDIYAQILEYQKANQKTDADKLPPLELGGDINDELSINSLPATPAPSKLLQWHAAPTEIPPEWAAAYAHDLCTYNMGPFTTDVEARKSLKHEFTSNELITQIIDEVRAAGSAPFGQVKQWIQQHCSTKPRPYRWELTEQTAVLYNWLEELIPEISWDRPNYSQVLRWTSR